MAIKPIRPLFSESATATNGSDTIAVTGNVDCSYIYDGFLVALGTRQVVEAISGTAPDGSGNSTITLRRPWAPANTTAPLLGWNSIEGLPAAVNRLRELIGQSSEINEELLQLAELNTTGVVRRTGQGEYDTIANGATGRSLLAATSAGGARTTLQVLQAGTADGQARTNLQNDGRFEFKGVAESALEEYKDGQALVEAIETKATLIADFVRNQHRVYEQYGLTDKAITDVLDTTRASTATYDSPFGVATAAVDESRITYDPETGACLGLLSEGSRTNLLLWSEDFSQTSAWSIGALIGAGGDGGSSPVVSNYNKYQLSNQSGSATVLQSIPTIVAGTSVSLSVFVSNETNVSNLLFNLGDFDRVNVRLADETIVGKSGASNPSNENVSVIRYPSGRRIIVSGVLGSSSSRAGIYAKTGNGVGYNDQFNGDEILSIIGMQLEAGSFPTSYIKTEASQVTRATDNNLIVPDHNISEFTVYAEFLGAELSTAARALSVGTSSTNRIELIATGIITQINGDTTRAIGANPSIDPNTSYRIAYKFNEGIVSLFLNGVKQGETAQAATTTFSSNGIRLSSNVTGTQPSKITVANLKYTPCALSDEELQELTKL